MEHQNAFLYTSYNEEKKNVLHDGSNANAYLQTY